MKIDGTSYYSPTEVTNFTSDPVCYPCPVGAKCDNTIQSLPNYWGYKDKNNLVVMIRCPDGYCCQNENGCDEINSCQSGRVGTLCGACKDNLTESLILPKCIPAEKCYTALVLLLYFTAVLSYALAILTMDSIKKKVLNMFKKILVYLKRVLGKQQKEKSDAEKASSTADDDGMKYLQILFYYVQDAELFKVSIPTENDKEENILIKILQISPEIVLSSYTKVSELCFTSTNTATTKVFLKFLFGPSIMLFLLLLYISQLILQKCKLICESNLKALRVCMTRAFLLIYLLSYQQLIKGAFALIQCVKINDTRVLYIEGEIECYTWWQTVIEFSVFANLIPAIFVLSFLPYSLKEKKLSLTLFHLSCVFPIPLLVAHTCIYLRKCILHHNVNKKLQKRSEIHSTIQSSNSESSVNIELECESNYHRRISLDTLGQEYVYSSSDTDIGSIYSHESEREINIENCSTSSSGQNVQRGSREEVLNTLLKHYKTLKLFSIKFSWLIVHKLYRTILVALNTYVTESVTRIFVMSLILIVISLLTSVIKPYKENNANTVAMLSYAANLCIALVSMFKVFIMTFDCRTNCPLKTILLNYLDVCEDVLLIYVPVGVVVFSFLYMGLKKCTGKNKGE